MRRWLIAAAILPLLGGCYYFQAVSGQMELWRKSRPIDALIGDARTDANLRERLEVVKQVRDFASRELALPDNGSYRKYADLQRPYVVWNVFATPELSMKPVEWCFPFTGCVAYRGYFDEAGAVAFAEGMRKGGKDVFVAGIPAYSTLGWFDDPVLNTFIGYPDAEIARLMFHELAHQVVYVSGDTLFNESFATAVELAGMERWLDRHGTPAQRAAFDRRQDYKAGFVALVLDYRDRLKALYASDLADDQKRARKAQAFASLRSDYEALKRSWGGFAGYDRFFTGGLNNAHIVPVATYAELVPAFRRLLAREQGDFARFYAAVRDIGRLGRGERAARLGVPAAATPES
ncbi:MAG TPA: aminopeptidase [Burkholderiales bacterium]|nr:aminopeptidase [Burkholderiales bacterium]